MTKPHYLVRRGRAGRFNFTHLTSTGRLKGFVTVSMDGRSDSELTRHAMDQIRTLAEDFARVQDTENSSPNNGSAEPYERRA